MADLITLDELRTRLGIDPTFTQDDAYLESIIPAISRIVVNFTGRDFGTPLVTEEREFQYDGDGVLDIDDCVDITRVAVKVLHAADVELLDDQYFAQPPRRDDSPVHYYLVLGDPFTSHGSPEMGFTRNLDRLWREGRWPVTPTVIKVTATWGWPVVPEDVKQAVVWTVQDWMNRREGEALRSEAIADYARGWGSPSGVNVATATALPSRALDVLAAYEKHQI